MLIIHRKSIMLMHRPQAPQPGFGSITLLQKFTPRFKIPDPRLSIFVIVIGSFVVLRSGCFIIPTSLSY